MFFLKKLPDDEMLKEFSSRNREMDIANVQACLHLLKVASEILRKLDGHFREKNLSQVRFLALMILEREKSHQLNCAEMTEALGISKPNMTRLLNSLETDGFIERKGNNEDKRVSVVAIRAKGSKILSEVLPGYYRIINKAMKPIDKASKEILISVLEKIEST